jgi:hypothetical protein
VARRLLLLAVCLASALALSGCDGSSDSDAAPRGEVAELTNVDALRRAFAHDDGSARLLVLLSPT